MYEYDGEDEDTRRRRREEGPYQEPEQTPAVSPRRPPDDPYYTQPQVPGIGTPESGYGWGGVENPAYNPSPAAPKPVKQSDAVDNRAPFREPTQTPSGGGPQPMFQPPAPPALAAAPAAQKPGITDEVTRILMGRLRDLQNPGDVASDPIYQQAVKQYQIGQLRGADRQRKALAERTAATTGTTSAGGFNVGVRGIQERAGENAAQYRSGLALDRLSAREDQLNKAIAAARAVGQDEIANSLELQRLQLQQELGRGDLALRGELGRGQLGLGYDNLGLSYADLVMRANRDATLAALQGG